MVERVTVGAGLDAADDWIAAHADARSIVITSDVPLASRCIKAGAQVIAANGRPFTDASIGMALAMRNLMADLRDAGQMSGGPAAFSARDRSAFLAELDRTIRRLQRQNHSVRVPPDGAALVQLGGIGLTFGGTPLLEGVDLTVAAGERVCLVGRNGSGKSTLLKIVAGLVDPDKGTRFLQPRRDRALSSPGA